MAQGLSAKQEAFAQAVASGKNQTEAYRLAGYSCPSPKVAVELASDLARNPKVAQRVAELRAPIIKKVGLTLESHLQTLEELRDEARADGQFSAAVKAEESRGKAAGLYVEKHEHAGLVQVETITRTIVDPNGKHSA